MRKLVIQRLTSLIEDGEGIPPYFDCEDDELITDSQELESMSDEQLIDMLEIVIGFGG